MAQLNILTWVPAARPLGDSELLAIGAALFVGVFLAAGVMIHAIRVYNKEKQRTL